MAPALLLARNGYVLSAEGSAVFALRQPDEVPRRHAASFNATATSMRRVTASPSHCWRGPWRALRPIRMSFITGRWQKSLPAMCTRTAAC